MQGSKGRVGEVVVMGNGLMCVKGGRERVMLNDLFIKFTNQKPVFVC